MTCQPTGAPLPGSMKFQLTELNLDNFTFQFQSLPIRGKQSHLSALFLAALKDINGFAPGCMFAIVYFAKIADLSLDNPVIRHTLVFNDTPITMSFAVFKAAFSPEKHAPIVLNAIRKSRE